jgi:1,4-dihydroxy-2-naphthoate octaprenyltransferase
MVYLRTMNPWIQAARLRTLPLALSGIILGAAISHLCYEGNSQLAHQTGDVTTSPWIVFFLAIITATLLQVLSNYANDLGDFTKGTDVAASRTDRALASGKIKPETMKRALLGLMILTLFVGCLLIWITGLFHANSGWYLLSIGVLAILAALGYTLGKNAYGYWGLGDFSVVLFFGLVPVLGMGLLNGFFYDVASSRYLDVFVFAGLGLGFLSAGVLNVNNYRDLLSDQAIGKKTLAVRLGESKTLRYHRLLLLIGGALIPLSLLTFEKRYFEWTSMWGSQSVFMLGVFSPIFIQLSSHYQKVKSAKPGDREDLNLQLKKLSLTILAMVVVYALLSFFIVDFLGPDKD